MLIDGGPEGYIRTSLTACEYFNSGCTCSKCNKKIEDMDKGITAEWARDESNRVLGERVSEEIGKCELEITKAVKKNEMSCNVLIWLHDKTIQELASRGFKINKMEGDRPMDSSYIKISW